jgi:hypothetical protein
MKLRRLNEKGVSEFSSFINHLRAGVAQNTPDYLLGDDALSESVSLDIDISDQPFSSRYEMGRYMVRLFAHHNMQPYMGDTGFWSWIALLWFDQLCPIKGGAKKPSKDYNYVLSKKYNHRPRHAIYMTWQLVSRYGKDAEFLLCKEMSTRGEITEEMMSRQTNLSSEAVMRLASELYFDPSAGTFKRGAAARKSAGCVARYIVWLEQLKVNYDLYLMTKDDLKGLLPPEFERFQQMINP